MAAGRVAPPGPLLLLLLGLLLAASSSASQSNHDHDEEELQIGAAAGGGDLWHTRGQNDASGERAAATRSRTLKRENELLDPFAFTFEDYLREASGAATSGNQRRADESDNLIAIDEQLPSRPLASSQLIVEDDDQPASVSSSRSHADTRQHPLEATNSKLTSVGSSSSSSAEHNNDIIRPNEPDESPAASNREEAEIRLHFAWVSLPTQRCSRACGRGQRLVHLSCHDLKYNVRVSDELCEAARLTRPSEHSDEPCNELDCPPKWTTLESRQCQEDSEDSLGCRKQLFKRLACTMLTRDGQTVHLDESRCSDTERPALMQSQVATASDANAPAPADEDLSIDLNEQLDKERNEILLNEMPEHEHERFRHKAGARHHAGRNSKHSLARPNEPFFEPAEWSECMGAPCGQLGKRTRKLACRIYLARSAKFVELPESSCLTSGATVQLEREEPCYLDCGPQGGATSPNQTSTHYHVDQYQDDQELTIETLPPTGGNKQGQRHEYKLTVEADEAARELEDEELLDPAAARYVWRHAHDWTKCSAECLGGVSESLVECWDRVVNTSVEQQHCEHLHRTKPEPLRRSCNEGPCAPEWRLSAFTKCSRPCGSTGSRSRSLACVQQVARALPPHNSANYMLVSNDLCLEQQQLANGSVSTPSLIEPCNRHDCLPEWSVGPWSECAMDSRRPNTVECASELGERNRSVVCLQEFASKWGPLESERVEASAQDTNATVSSDLRESIQMAAPSWQPGKSTQIPFEHCYRHYHSAPAPSERCTPPVCLEPELFIEAEPAQDYRMLLPDGTPNPNYSTRRRTVTLKVGGRAQLLEGRHVKIRCRILAKSRKHLVGAGNETATATTGHSNVNYQVYHEQHVEWRKDGVRIFAPNTTMADKQPLEETDNSISILGGAANDELLDNELSINFEPDKYSMMAADEPETRRQQRLEAKARAPQLARPKARRLSVRSGPSQDFQFVGQPGGRFTLVKENTLRIKRLRPDDSGTYTCSSGANLSESIELSVLSKRARHRLADFRGQLKRRMPTKSAGSNHERTPSSGLSSTGTNN